MVEDFAREIELWYGNGRRDLPWRETKDPYLIWISEIILQQTRVVQGYDYYLRFVERFPDVFSLAAADEDEVLRLWQGLGYYSRARNLHSAARDIAARGKFPDTYDGVRSLKGVGDYTAAAICSFAYGLPHAVVDGNVYRVLSRYYGIKTPMDTSAGKKEFARLAARLLDVRRPGLYNQALMDFGALQCTPQQPDCLSCPLSGSCSALQQQKVLSFPVKSKRTAVRSRYFVYFYVRSGDEILLRRRPSGDIWQGLYEPPMLELGQPMAEETLLQHPVVQSMHGKQATICLLAKGVKHVLTHRCLYADFYEVNLPGGFQMEGYFPVPESERDGYAVPRLVSLLYEKCDARKGVSDK